MPALFVGLRPEEGFRVTGISCPSCCGVLQARTSDSGYVEVRCRVGHLYSRDELIAAQEARLEGALWKATLAIEELAALLSDLEEDAKTEGREVEQEKEAERYRKRRRRLENARRQLGRILDENERIDLGRAVRRPDGRE